MSVPLAISEGMVSLSFDDALDEHLDFAVPILGEHGLTGTFYVPLSASGFTTRLDEWRAAAAGGHELGNHTIFHPADRRKPWVRPGNEIDRYTLDRMQQELDVANRLLAAPGRLSDANICLPVFEFDPGPARIDQADALQTRVRTNPPADDRRPLASGLGIDREELCSDRTEFVFGGPRRRTNERLSRPAG